MELHQVRYFAALCKTLNFTRAAEACYVGQSALTRAIQRLEEELGGPLFQRERNLTQLTALGRLVRPLLEQSLAMAEAAREHAVEFAKGERASLRLGLPPTIFADVAGRILADVLARLPALEVEIFADAQPRTIEKLLQGEVDAAFLIDHSDLPPRLNRWPLYKESFRIVVAPAHPLATLETVSAKALAGERMVECRDCKMAVKLREFCASMDAPLGVRHWVETDEHLQLLAAKSLGIGLLPERTPVMPPLVTRTISDLDLTRSVAVAVVGSRRFTPAIDLFIRIARARNFSAETDAAELIPPKSLSSGFTGGGVSDTLRESERRYRGTLLELTHANRVATMGQLTASIAREVNQPIAGVVTNANAALRWLSAQPPQLEEVRQALARIGRDGKRAGDVISRIRALVKKVPQRTDKVVINEAILEAIALTHGEVLKNGVSVQTELADGLPSIEGDWVQLQQVILNLIVNAIEAMSTADEGSRKLQISTELDASGRVLVAVRDSGPGLDAASLGRIFEAFYTTKPSGIGMGLAISRSIIEAHGGRVWATPNIPSGAAFWFSLPPPATQGERAGVRTRENTASAYPP